jgi:hypothetical protein
VVSVYSVVKMDHHSDALHQITLYTTGRQPLLTGELRTLTEHGIRNLPVRYPGLRVLSSTVQPDRVEMTLDFQKLDEDVLRVIQSLKSEVKNLGRKKGLGGDSLWQWQYDDLWVAPGKENPAQG